MPVDNPPRPLLLIVEDSASVAVMQRALFEREGFAVETVENGEQAMALLRERTPDVILLDVMLPDTDGYELCTTIRRFDQWTAIPVLMLTALDDTDARVRGLTAGADDYVGKGADHAELLARVRRLLARAKAQEQLTERERLVTLHRAASTMAHCINNPLQVLSMGLEMLTLQYGEDESTRELLNKMEGHLARIREHVSRLGELTRIVEAPELRDPAILDMSEGAASGRRSRRKGQKYKVLVVDDDDELRLLVRYSLEATRRFDVLEAGDGAGGLEKARSELPDLVLADVNMPVLDGYGMCAEMKRDLLLRGIPVILLTGNRLLRDIVKGFDAGAANYLIKPVDPVMLPEQVFRTLERNGITEPETS